MFLFCVKRSGLSRIAGTAAQRVFRMGQWVVTIATDEWLSSCQDDPAGVSAREMSPLGGGSNRSADLLLTDARFVAAENAVELARTLIGGRQLYYHASPQGELYCATHVRLLRAAGMRLEENDAALAELFIYRYVTPPQTLFKNVEQLLAGQTLRFEFDGSVWRITGDRRYSPPRPESSGAEDASHWGQQTGQALRDAMLALHPAASRVHLLASGGLDSSILVKLAQTHLGVRRSHSTAYPFEDEAHNVEERYALSAAAALGTDHHHFVPEMRDFLRAAVEVVAIGEEPTVFTQSLLLLLLFRHGLPPGRGIVVSGQGADGLFGLRLHHTIGNVERFRRAHPWLSFTTDARLWSAMRPILGLRSVANALRPLVGRFLYDANAFDALAGSRWDRGIQPADPRHVLSRLGVGHAEEWTLRRFGATRQQAIGNRASALGAFSDRDVLDMVSMLDFLSDVSVSQAVWSKLAESIGKFVYYPFNAPPVMDCAFAAPWAAKLAAPKAILRDVARTVGVSEFIIRRPKANFNITTHNWAAPGGVFEPLVPLAASVWDPQELHEVRTGWRNSFTFWTMVNYAIWKRLFIRGESPDALFNEIDYAGVTDTPVPAAL